MKVTWDEKKRKQVIKDHGVDLARIEDVLDDPFAIDFSDADHSAEEERRIIFWENQGLWINCRSLYGTWRSDPVYHRPPGGKMGGTRI
jgi:uncharacterized DUF497 family protein